MRSSRIGRFLAVVGTLLAVGYAGTSPGPAAVATGPIMQSIELSEDALAFVSSLPIPPLSDVEPTLRWERSKLNSPAQDRSVVDDFESGTWPDRARWPLVSDLAATTVPEPGHFWATSECEASAGGRSLRATGGGDGAALGCDAGYPPDVASSALLYLDLRDTLYADSLELRFDAWLDADPDEGLMINLVTFDATGTMAERRILHTATGRSRAWWRGVTLDLTALSDRLDPSWSKDLRGRRVYLEVLFVSHDGSSDGTGAYIDNVAIEAVIPPTPTATSTPRPTATPTRTPTAAPRDIDRVNACRSLADCDSLTIRAYTDYGCDGRYQAGVDTPLSGARVRVSADLEALGAAFSRSGLAYFRFPRSAVVSAEIDLPPGYEMCPGLTNPMTLEARKFRRSGRASLSFRIRRIR